MTPVGRARVAGMIGNALEWYDFAVYGYFAPVLGRQFFPSDDPAVSLIASFGVFAIASSRARSAPRCSATWAIAPAGAAFFWCRSW